jgi:hypothetical protein
MVVAAGHHCWHWHRRLVFVLASNRVVDCVAIVQVKRRAFMKPRIGEQTMKAWVTERAIEAGVTVSTIYSRIYRGKLKPKVTRRKNARVVFVRSGNVLCGT